MKINSYEIIVYTVVQNGLKILLIDNLGNEFFADENKANYGSILIITTSP